MLANVKLNRTKSEDGLKRCEWATFGGTGHLRYHDEEWGVPVHDDRKLFEFLVLEGAQAGLSWLTVLRKRENYRRSFDGFDPRKVVVYSDSKVQELINNEGIIRNKSKILSAISNAQAFLEVQKEFGSFDSYVWKFIGGKPRTNRWRSIKQIPAKTPESEAMSKDMIARGFKFVGPTICYAHMQATGMVNDHIMSCFRYREISGKAARAGQGRGA